MADLLQNRKIGSGRFNYIVLRDTSCVLGSYELLRHDDHSLAVKTDSRGVFSIVFFWRGNSLLKAVGYENAGYGNSAHRKRDLKAGFGGEDYSRGLRK